ncbi:hypothetical protein AAFF_G00279070 [Aldrovandia affinis]|uniref:Uncharacterized protein n=1 Tax=Aldrovandia affinis TaxID=143900 RepID=A0AAD7SRK3_9TELE|nr:hypothetical protein AAFF_G00279070 [Aldrovandia affinis]
MYGERSQRFIARVTQCNASADFDVPDRRHHLASSLPVERAHPLTRGRRGEMQSSSQQLGRSGGTARRPQCVAEGNRRSRIAGGHRSFARDGDGTFHRDCAFHNLYWDGDERLTLKGEGSNVSQRSREALTASQGVNSQPRGLESRFLSSVSFTRLCGRGQRCVSPCALSFLVPRSSDVEANPWLPPCEGHHTHWT